MKQRNLHIAVAALALGVQLASPAAAGINHADLSLLSTAVAAGEASEMSAVLGQNPQLAAAVARVGENDGIVVLVKGGRGGNNGNGNGRGNDNRGNGRGDDNGNHRGHDQGRGHNGSRGNHGGHGRHGGIY